MIRQRSKDDATTSTGPSSAASFSDSSSVSRPKIVDDHLATFPSKRLAPEDTFPKSLFQLVPMFVLYPIWQVSRYLLFFAMILKCLATFPGIRNIGTLVIAYLVFHLIWITITPLVFVVIKWTVVGRYKAGRYPIWSTYYLRWWFVDVCRKLFLRGIWGSNETLLNFYYRLLGAKIGKKARISLECDMAEFDLVSIGEDAAIEFATVRAFGVDNGAMMLGPVSVGRSASVGARSVVAPYTSIPDGCHLGPVTSSYETGKALDTKHARYNRRCMPEPQWWMLLLIEGPITFLVNAFGQIPPLLVLFAMLEYKSDADQVFSTPSDLMEWLCDPMRIPFFIGIRVARALLSPFFYMAAAILVKKLFIGKFEQGPRDASSQWQLLRHHLSASLFSRLRFQAVADIVGRHYELVSCLYRLVGAKVGQRVFWPGYQPAFSGEFDLLEIGDDVVFGSRSTIFFATVDTCEKVTLCAGSNVSDNCVVLPGSSIGKNAVLGSNSVCPEGWYLPEESVWFGSNGCEPACLKMGTDVESFTDGPMLSCHSTDKIQMDGDDSTLRPFGRAFYLRQASYYVWPLSWIISATVMIKTFIVVFHTLPLLGALHGAACQLYGLAFAKRDYTIEFQFYEM
jgi:acetyltransferase-like isoleucine patch superfamily enzyme